MNKSKKLRVGLFLPSLQGGGAERVMVALANGFVEKGVKVDLVLSKASGPYLNELNHAVRVIDLKASRVLFSLYPLIRYLRTNKPQVLLSTLGYANIIALWAKALSGGKIKCIIRIENTISAKARYASNLRSKFIPWCLKFFSPLADSVVVVSKTSAQDLIKFLRIPKFKISVIYNPVVNDELFEKAKMRIEHPWFVDGQPPIILGVGRLSKQKDFSTLIQAFALLRKKRKVRLIILGEGDERSKLEGLISKLGVSDDIALPGFIANPFPYMIKASVFVLCSRWEGLPNSLIQAIALGTPVIATNCPGGSAEILEEAKMGRLTLVGDVEGLFIELNSSLDCQTRGINLQMSQFRSSTVVNEYLRLINKLYGLA